MMDLAKGLHTDLCCDKKWGW